MLKPFVFLGNVVELKRCMSVIVALLIMMMGDAPMWVKSNDWELCGYFILRKMLVQLAYSFLGLPPTFMIVCFAFEAKN